MNPAQVRQRGEQLNDVEKSVSKHEAWLRDTLAELLEIDRTQLSVTQTFAELGMDSLIGLRLTRKLQDRIDEEVELEWIFDYPSIRQLSQFLDTRFGELDLIGVKAG
ncbi:MAG: acyl carrier protein [Pseudomonadota bacterium]|nr:acyl carrier protein [Pseudomonadota bacterium]